jgi:hypothetical protein
VTDADGLAQGRQLALVATPIAIAAPTYTLTVTTPAPASVGASFAVAGTYSGGGVPVTLDWSVDGGATWTAAVTPTIGAGAYSFTIAAGLPVGTYRITVRDHVAPSSFGTSGLFTLAQTSPPVLPTIATPLWAMDTASAVGVLFTDTGMTAQAAAGDSVAGIKDALGGTTAFTQATPGACPVLAANVHNGLPGLRFTGSLAQFLAQSAGTLSATMKASGGYGALVVFTPATLPPVAQDVMDIGTVTTSFSKARLLQQLASGQIRHGRQSDTAVNYAVEGTTVAANTLIKAVSRWDGTNLKLAANAIAENTSAAMVGAFTAAWPETSVIGASQDPGSQFFLDGWIHEIRIWNSAVSDADRTNLLTYATSKWGS